MILRRFSSYSVLVSAYPQITFKGSLMVVSAYSRTTVAVTFFRIKTITVNVAAEELETGKKVEHIDDCEGITRILPNSLRDLELKIYLPDT